MTWWDCAVYVGMGKYIFSLGKEGLWEPIRPILWPIILGFLWKLKLDPIYYGRLLNMLISSLIILLSYSITKKIYDKKTALIASTLVSFSSIFFFFNYRLYTEIPAMLFVLIALYFYLKERFFLTGLFLSLSFLTKFPAGIFIICFIFVIIFKKQLKALPFLFYGLIIPLLPYLILNQALYGDALSPILAASAVIKKVVGCNILRREEWYSYFFFIIKDNILNVFVLFGIYNITKKFTKDRLLIILLFVFSLIYLIQLPCREYRYILLFLPFISILTANGLLSIKIIKEKYFLKTLIAVAIISLIFSMTYYLLNETRDIIPERENFYRFAENKTITNEVWITNPIINLYLPKKADLLYYSVYDSNTLFDFKNYINSNRVSYVFFDTCGGGMTCSPEDKLCEEKTAEFIENFSSYGFKKVYDQTYGECKYYIFKK